MVSSILSILSFSVFCLTDGKIFSHFLKTNISFDKCSDLNGKKLKTRSLVGCGIICTNNLECRRFLFCSKDFSCTLYADGTNCVMSEDSTTCSCYRKKIGRRHFNFTCPLGYYGDNCVHVVKDCSEAYSRGLGQNLPDFRGQTYIKPSANQPSFEQFCMYLGVGVMPILKHSRECSKLDLNRSMAEYEDGFGASYKNRWAGFDKIFAVMNSSTHLSYTLQITLTNSKNQKCNSFYKDFALGNKSTGYKFTASYKSSSQCGDSMLGSLSLYGRPFSTYDSDHTGSNKCPSRFGGGWWFHNSPGCSRSFLTGTFDASGKHNVWKDDQDGERIKAVTMIIFGK